MVASMESEGNEAKPQLCFSVSWRSEERGLLLASPEKIRGMGGAGL